jgi:uncharacterized membrane protein YhaH (DUF805 family)
MGLFHYLFGFSGRINRAKQWAILLVGLVNEVFLAFVFAFTIGFAALGDLAQHNITFPALIATPQAHMFGYICCLLFAAMFYIALAVATKRLHDRNRSAWWLVIFFLLPMLLNIPAFMRLPEMFQYMDAVMKAAQAQLPPPPQPIDPPLVILSRGAASLLSLWAFVELYCLRGTVGDNRYGPDPLAG